LFNRLGKKEHNSKVKQLKDLTPMIAPSSFLLEGKRPDLVDNIRNLCELDAARFDSMCLHLIHNVIDHCQQMPETLNSYYAMPGGLVDHALNRTQAALSLFKQFGVQEVGAGLSEEQKLWVYALFSAGMLQGIGKLQIDYRVDIFDGNGHFLKPWSPLIESMADVGANYQFQFQPEGERDLRCRLTVMLARILMPAAGFAWIISNPEVLAVWLALLSEDAHGSRSLGALLVRADAFAIQRYFDEWLIKMQRMGRSHRIGTFSDSVPESVSDKDRIIGIEFIKWLTAKLESGELMINKIPLLMVPGGMLLLPEIFQLFVRDNPAYKPWQLIQRAFLSLGLHRMGIDGDVMTRFEQANTHHMHSGVLFSKYALALPEQMKLHHIPTGGVSKISATQLLYQAQFDPKLSNRQATLPQEHALQVLSLSGQWQSGDKKGIMPSSKGK
jgi:integrating conjugative element relaxase (TIGR03760 family)